MSHCIHLLSCILHSNQVVLHNYPTCIAIDLSPTFLKTTHITNPYFFNSHFNWFLKIFNNILSKLSIDIIAFRNNFKKSLIQLCYIFKYEIAHSKEEGVEYRQNREIISARGCNSSREILGIGFSSIGREKSSISPSRRFVSRRFPPPSITVARSLFHLPFQRESNRFNRRPHLRSAIDSLKFI